MLNIRPAVKSDIDGIMHVERETFGNKVSDEAMASETTMLNRIALYEKHQFLGFWVAEYEKKIVGDIIFHPTRLTPAACTSWATATDNGSMEKTFDVNGENIYVTSLAVSNDAPLGVPPLLAHASFTIWVQEKKNHYMFCSRMPGFKRAHKKTNVSPEEYWRQTDETGAPKDGMLKLYHDMTGAMPIKLLPNGFPPDGDSGGHGVLFATSQPFLALQKIALCIQNSAKNNSGGQS